MNESIRQQKIDQVNELVQRIQTSKSMIVTDYLGLSVEQMTDLRRKLFDAGCEIEVIKNNITRRAAKEAGFDQLDSDLVGPNAIAFSKDDAIAAAKILYDFAKTADQLELKAGIIDGKYAPLEELVVYAQLPSRETLLTQVAAGLLGNLRNLAIALHLFTELNATEEPAAEPVKETAPAPAAPEVEAAPEVAAEPAQEAATETTEEAEPVVEEPAAAEAVEAPPSEEEKKEE
jgi:large subunit ribosomal protein L10